MSTVTENVLTLRALADLYEMTVKVRIAAENRLRATEQGRDDSSELPAEIANYPLVDKLEAALDQARDDMERALPSHPVAAWLMGVPGINKTLGCRILGMIPMEGPQCLACGGALRREVGRFRLCTRCRKLFETEIEKCPTCDSVGWEVQERTWVRTCLACGRLGSDFDRFSQLRVFAGICPGRNKLTKGEKAPYSTRLKTTLYVAFGSMLKVESLTKGKPWAPQRFYAEIYKKWRTIYLQRYGDGKGAKEAGWPKLRQHLGAKNKLLDVFLCHLWREWREAEGWSVDSLYVHEVLGHHMDYEAADFSSAAMATRKMKNGQPG